MSGRGRQRFLWTVLLPGLAGWGGGFCFYRNRAAEGDRGPVQETVASSADQDAASAAADDEDKNPALRARVAALEKRLMEKHLKKLAEEEQGKQSGAKLPPPEKPAPEPTPEEELRILFETWPRTALRLAERLLIWSGNEQWQPLWVGGFSPAVLPEVRAWIERMPRGQARLRTVFSVLQEWQWLDPAGAAAALRSCEGEAGGWSVLWVTDYILSALPIGERIAYLRTLSPGAQAKLWTRNTTIRYSDQYFDSRENGWIHHYPAQAASEMARALAGSDREKTLENWFNWWSERDPAAALTGAQSALPDDNLRTAAGRTAMASWAQDEPAKAAQYLREMPSGAARDGAAEAMATVMRKSHDGGDGTDWLGMIADPASRQAAKERLEKTISEGKTTTAPPSPP